MATRSSSNPMPARASVLRTSLSRNRCRSGRYSRRFSRAEMVVKVKEPQAIERAMLREGRLLFTCLLAPDPDQTRDLINGGATCIAYETVTSPWRVAFAGTNVQGGRAYVDSGRRLLSTTTAVDWVCYWVVFPGRDPAKVVILGAGMVGTHTTRIAVGMGADVWVIVAARSPENHWKQFGRGTNTCSCR